MNGGQLSEEQAAVYDRQLRLWGRSVQTRLSQSHLLLQGQGGLLAEVAKNLALAGIGKISIHLTNGSNYLCEWAQNKSQSNPTQNMVESLSQLNPFIQVAGVSNDIKEYSSIDYVVCINEGINQGIQMQEMTSDNDCRFVYAGQWAGCGFIFSDYNDCINGGPKASKLLSVVVEFEKQTGRSVFQDLEASDEITLMEIIKQLFPESMDLLGQYIAIGCQGVCKSNAMLDSIVGGLLTNGIIKQLGEQEKDARIEFMMFDPFEEVAWVKPIQQQYRKKVKVRRDQD
eukprot:TRINITY_DN24067_c0_g2_i1.p1 TRINITY_DN24067_c0_g2~~TRINITY_DN24067_c0_g2_i1.p1  ORF type:complete len:285 (-),score=25.89 TRINITY_DN24067_c0_g2_i1:472-1326(-)